MQIPAGTIEVLTLLLVIITAIYVYLNYLMVKRNGEMVAQIKAQHEAFLAPVIIYTDEDLKDIDTVFAGIEI